MVKGMNSRIVLLLMAASAAAIFSFFGPNPPSHVLLAKTLAGLGMGVVFYFSFKRAMWK
jgi:hypothetical protein